jgi:predicted DNA binding protein
MSVIAEFRVPSTSFELGHILTIEGATTIELERLVPIGGATVPLFWVHNSTRDSFINNVQRHESVNETSIIDRFEDRTLFTLDWDSKQDRLFEGIEASAGQLLSAVGTPDAWDFELRFPTHDALSEFTSRCEEANIRVEMKRIYNPTNPEGGPWYGLTEPQREAMILAVQMGYYDIPRGCTTKEIAEILDISDQAVTERLRRAIVSLVRNTLTAIESDP